MVLDLICSLSSEENFVAIQNNVGNSSAVEKVRRLSLQNGKIGHGKPKATLSIEDVRSVIVFPSSTDHIPTLENFRVLRVLDLGGCDLSQGYRLKFLGNLLHLWYLGLKHTKIYELPEEIVQLLQILDIEDNPIDCLPSSVISLTKLKCLHINEETRAPKGVGRLTALEELSYLGIHDDSMDIVEELGHLAELRVLGTEILSKINREDNRLDKSLVECLNKLHKTQNLFILIKSGECNLDGWVVAPQHLRRLELHPCCLFSALPGWVNPSLLGDLSVLQIRVKGLQQEDLEILGRLPALCSLHLWVDHEDLGIHGAFVVGACSFACLVICSLWGFGLSEGPWCFNKEPCQRSWILCLTSQCS
jgi:hypothetical protein